MADEGQLLAYFHGYVASIRKHLSYVCSVVQPFHVDMLLNLLAAEDFITPESFGKIEKSSDGEKAQVLFEQLLLLPSPIWCQTVLQTLRQMGLDEAVDVIEGIKSIPMIAIPEIAESSKSSTGINNVFDVLEGIKPRPVIPPQESESKSSSVKDFEANFFEMSNSDSSGSFNIDEVSDQAVMSLDDGSGDGNKLNLRNYQLELAEPAVGGANCVIVAPTGCGKTYVALHIALEHLVRSNGEKVVFLVNKTPLVQQQFELFKKFIEPKGLSVEQISGANSANTPAVRIITSTKVLVMTHQILLNALEETPDLMNKISLLIFDECHHAMKKHPYNQIMSIYLKKKAEEMEHNLPQIVGLTASPGSGKSSTVEQGCKHVLKLLANLNVKIPPVQVKENLEELSAFTTNDNFETVSVERRYQDQFSIKVQRIMQRIEKQIEDQIAKNENVLEDFVFKVPERRGRPEYENGVINFRDRSILIKDTKLSQQFQIYANYLKVYNNALLINEHVRESDAIKYIEDNLFKTHDVEIKLKELFDKSEISKLATRTPGPLLQRLIEIIQHQFADVPNSRCIIFAQTRDIATSLVTCLCESEVLAKFDLNPDYLTGAGAKNSQGGLTKPLQDEKLKRFRDGKSKVMIATSIADEGIDIKACNLVVTYNHCSNEIAQVQRKGRGRAKESKMFILAYQDRGFIEKENINRDRNQLTNLTLEHLQTMDHKKLSLEVEAIQEKNCSAVAPTTSGQQRVGGIWKLSCIRCKREVTSSDQFRMVKQHYACIDEQFPFKPFKCPMKTITVSLEEHVCGKLLCGNATCRQEWGSQMIYKGLTIYVLAIRNFVLTNGEDTMVKKCWKDAPFHVDKSFDDHIILDEVDVDMDDDDIYNFDFD